MTRRPELLLIIILALPSLAFAGSEAQESPWAPPAPEASAKDWVRLSSGEWLRGTIDLMRDESLQFDSDELDEVTIDWTDIHEIRSPRPLTYVMPDGSMITGTSAMKEGLVRVATPGGAVEFPRSRVHSILEGEPTELNFWSLNLGADLKIRTGNTNQNDLGSRIFIKREAAKSRIDVRYQGNFSKTDDIETVRNHRGNVEWKIFLSRKFFVTPVKVEFFADKFQNIDLRVSGGAGFGYFITRSSSADWFVELGGGYQMTEYESVQPGENTSVRNWSAPFRTTLETDLSKTIELRAEYGVQIGIGHDANTIHHTFILFDFDLFGNIDFNASMTWDHVTKPKTNAEGITPLKDDVAMAYGLSLDF